MYLETKEIGPEGLVIDRRITLTLSPAREGEDPVGISEVHLSGEVMRSSGGISFMGDLATVATRSCSRCLEAYELPLDLHFDLLYTTVPETFDKGNNRMDEDSITVTHYDGARIDLGQLVAEQIYLGLSLKPLCRIDCRGLCPRCGANLNLGVCGCQEEGPKDPRLLVLKTIR